MERILPQIVGEQWSSRDESQLPLKIYCRLSLELMYEVLKYNELSITANQSANQTETFKCTII